ncbi:uncharacterized protein PAE49_011383 isoform 1-T2 [Odontesthes bonariensis]|uniref:uncharacterized protein LOC142390437 n=1 Tax=Odontesthes bonariensis TaxID=219752 RepID=UPI003F58C912
MDVTSHLSVSDGSEGGATGDHNQSECICGQPETRRTGEAPPPLSDRLDSSDSLMDGSSTSDISRLLPGPHRQKGVDSSARSPPPVCTPPSRSSTCKRHHHQSTNQKRQSSTRSHASLKTDAAHIKEVAGDDCCAHCLLACLFCELLSMCSAVGECLACGVGGVGCCDAAAGCSCCVEAACTEEACQAVLDCGTLEDCCGSSDCLEICLECCSICFPS